MTIIRQQHIVDGFQHCLEGSELCLDMHVTNYRIEVLDLEDSLLHGSTLLLAFYATWSGNDH